MFKTLFETIPDLPIYIGIFLIMVGIYYIYIKGSGAYYKEEIEDFLIAQTPEDELMLKLGSEISANKYRLILYLVCLALFVILGFAAVKSDNVGNLILALILCTALGFLGQPKKYIYKNIKAPFYIVANVISKSKQKDYEEELFSSVSYFKNLAVAQKGRSLSGDAVIESLSENSKKLKPLYAMTLQLYRQGQKNEALKRFALVIGTRNANTFSQILEKVDKMSPEELAMQITALHETMLEERFTKGLEKAGDKGNLLFTLTTVCAFMCLINFLFVTVVQDAMTMLGGFM